MRIYFLYSTLIIFPALFFYQRAIGQTSNPEALEASFQKAVDEKDNGKASYYSYELAKIYLDKNEREKADEYLSECISYGKKADDNMLVYLSYQLLGSMLSEEKDYNKALNNYQRALKQAEELGKTEFISEGLLNVAITYAQLGRHKRSIEPLEEALSIAIREKDILLQQQCYELLADYYKKLGDAAKAREYQTLYDNIIEKQQNEEQTEQQLKDLEKKVQRANKEKRTTSSRLNRQNQRLRQTEDSLLSVKYSLEETAQSLKIAEEISKNQQLQIDLLNKDRELAGLRIKEQNARIQNEKFIRNAFIFGTIVATAFVLVLIRNYRKKVEANKQIARQNKNIQSSINYARRIQEAMLHKGDILKDLVPESFIFFKPRDSVSGDFYWISEIKSWYDPDIVIAAVDCTGHGIPGAFMSMIGINALNSLIGQGIAESDQILQSLDKEIRTALQQETTGNKDGMDVALCIYRKEKSIIEFSGAKNPLVYIQDNELYQIKGDVHPIGGTRPKKDFSYQKHIVPIDQPTTLYIYSDGFQDQFGGPENTKFMTKRFKKLLLEIHKEPMEKQKEILASTIEEWIGEGKQTDDILVIGMRLEELDV